MSLLCAKCWQQFEPDPIQVREPELLKLCHRCLNRLTRENAITADEKGMKSKFFDTSTKGVTRKRTINGEEIDDDR